MNLRGTVHCAPTIDEDYAVQVVRHHDVLVNRYIVADGLGSGPFLSDGLAEFVGVHCAVNNLPQQRVSIVGADRNEMCARLRLIVVWQAHRTTAVAIGIVGKMYADRAAGWSPLPELVVELNETARDGLPTEVILDGLGTRPPDSLRFLPIP